MENEIIIRPVNQTNLELEKDGITIINKPTNDKSITELLKLYWKPSNWLNFKDKVSRKDFWLVYLLNWGVGTLVASPLLVLYKPLAVTVICLYLFINYLASISFLKRRANSAGTSGFIVNLFYIIPFILTMVLITPLTLELLFTDPIDFKSTHLKGMAGLALLSFIPIAISSITYTIIGLFKDKNESRT